MKRRGTVTAMVSAMSAIVLSAAAPAHADHDLIVAVNDSTAETTRTINAWQNAHVPMFYVTFTAAIANEKRLIRGRVNASQPNTTTDAILMVSTTVGCVPTGQNPFSLPVGSQDHMQQVQNVRKGQSLTLLPRFIFTAPTPGSYTCGLNVGSARPRPVDPDVDPQSNVYTVDTGSFVQATVAIPGTSAQSYQPEVASIVLQDRADFDAVPMNWTAPAGVTSFSVNGDIKLTACTAVGGSTDPVTGIMLCRGLSDPTGSTVKTALHVMQRRISDPSSFCEETIIPGPVGRTTLVDKDAHHQMLYEAAHMTVNTAPDCSRDYRIKIYVKHYVGSAVIVHRQGTITTVIPE